jgi:uncharacterized protein
MPLVNNSFYKPPFYLFDKHLETIVPNSFRKVDEIKYQRERFHTSDQDFLLLDWLKGGFDKLVVLAHGLEGDSNRLYMKGMARFFSRHNWDVMAWNCRSCGGEMNRLAKMYHHGETEDLKEVLDYVAQKKDYKSIALIGFSMGGSIILKYLGINKNISSKIRAAVAISTPCNLKDSMLEVQKPSNRIYYQRFLKALVQKLKTKIVLLPDIINDIDRIKSFDDIHKIYTTPVYGFENTDDFYKQASAVNYLEGITVPSLIINAQNDPMLPKSCSPVKIAKDHPNVYLDTPSRGGHVGFTLFGQTSTWSEIRSHEFVDRMCGGGES